MVSQFRLVVEEALTGVEQSVREVETTYGEMASKCDAMLAVADEANYLFDRWKTLPGTDDSAVLLLDNLLDAQERLADEEAAMVRAGWLRDGGRAAETGHGDAVDYGAAWYPGTSARLRDPRTREYSRSVGDGRRQQPQPLRIAQQVSVRSIPCATVWNGIVPPYMPY